MTTTKEAILRLVASGELEPNVAANLLQQGGSTAWLSCKVSPKRAISVYGLQRLPVTLYADQWERLRDFMDEIEEFIEENDANLARKDRNGNGRGSSVRQKQDSVGGRPERAAAPGRLVLGTPSRENLLAAMGATLRAAR